MKDSTRRAYGYATAAISRAALAHSLALKRHMGYPAKVKQSFLDQMSSAARLAEKASETAETKAAADYARQAVEYVDAEFARVAEKKGW